MSRFLSLYKAVVYGMSKNLRTCQNPRADSWNYIRVKRIPILEPLGVGLREALLPRHASSKLKLKFVTYESIPF